MEELPKNEKEHIMEDDTWLTPIEVFYKQGKNRKYKYVKCMCKCGNEKNVRLDSYKSGRIRSCGCYSTYKKKNKYGYVVRAPGALNLIRDQGKEYFPIFDLYGYYVTIDGEVYSAKTNKILKQTSNKKGYRVVCTANYTNKSNTQIVHRLVAQTFILNPNNLPQVNHKDFNKSNNHVTNIEWCTNEYNTAHKLDSYRSGKRKNPNAKLSETQVREIRNSTMKINELATKHNVSRSTIRDILNKKYWRWVK